jgi:glycosyltransferase involved in cell wall biosynthesis
MVVSNSFVHDARVNKEARSLSGAGYEVTVYATGDGKLPNEERTESVLVKRLPVRRYSLFRPNMFRAPFDFLPSLLKIIRERADVYHAHDLDTLLICYLASRFNRSKLVYDSHELFLEMEKSHLINSWWRKIAAVVLLPIWRIEEKFCAKRADYVITVNESIKNILVKRLGIKNIMVLINCPPFKEANRGREFHKELSLPEEAKVILYQGGIMWRRAMKQIVDALEYLPKDIYLILMGGGEDKNALAKYVSAKDYSTRIKFHEEVSLEDLPRYTASADLGVVPLLNVSLNNYYGLPNKLFEYMAAGIPVAASNFPEIKKIVIEEKIGVCFDPENPKNIAQAIIDLLSDPKKMEKMSANALRASKEIYNWDIEEKKLLSIYKRL